MTPKPKALFAGGLLLIAFPLLGNYVSADEKMALQQGLLDAKHAKEQAVIDQQNEVQRVIAVQKAKQQRDSLNYYLEAAQKLQKAHKSDAVEKTLALALALAATPEDRADVERTRSDFNTQNTFALIKEEKYSAALPGIELLIAQRGSTPELLYNRALCYSKTGKEEQAVTDCKAAMQSGNKEAERLYEKINPIRRTVSYYVTRCCDGSTSNATGRGACSHHGGVCNWNEPVYEESRKYE